ncbi:MAG TPA: TIGR03089 family protein [Mycobacteriales bacterium]|nr:TIGR03089 family protein [Mycobacteriales bacterium]
MQTPAELLNVELRRDGARPFITAYDAEAGRVELSVATTANWVAKVAGYLEDELGVGPGDQIEVAPTLHWLTAVVLLAGWAVGAEVCFDPAAAAQQIEVPLDPMGAGLLRLVAAYPDRYVPASPSGKAAAGDVPAGARLLTTLPLDGTGVGPGLLGPLAAGGSVVYVAAPELAAKVAADERVTHTAGVDVAGLPRLG